jgi:hypothetical protein
VEWKQEALKETIKAEQVISEGQEKALRYDPDATQKWIMIGETVEKGIQSEFWKLVSAWVETQLNPEILLRVPKDQRDLQIEYMKGLIHLKQCINRWIEKGKEAKAVLAREQSQGEK